MSYRKSLAALFAAASIFSWSGASADDKVPSSSKPLTIRVTGPAAMLNLDDTSSAHSRGREFESRFPVSARNPQQLSGILSSVPGVVPNTANQVHARGEHSATAIVLHGFQLGGVSQGRFGTLIDPQVFEGLDVMTGGFAPEFAGGAAILNTSIRSGTVVPQSSVEVGGGNNGTGLLRFTHQGQSGAEYGAPLEGGVRPKAFSYFLSGSARTTDNALEPPQPSNQTEHNGGQAYNALGRFDFRLSDEDDLTLIASAAPARTEVANRTGLPAEYAAFGQGYGFGGALSAADAAARGIVSQADAGQDIVQKDQNDFGMLQWRKRLAANVSSVLSFGLVRSKLDTTNDNPLVDLNALPEDSSIEYNPTVRRSALHRQASGVLTWLSGRHEFKFGGNFDFQTSDDSYELIPASQRALNALYAADSRLVGSGSVLTDSDGNEVTDELGNPVYILDDGAVAPRVKVSRDGHSAGLFAQDTWQLHEQFTANYGIRFDSYRQSQDFGLEDVQKHQYSPRVNLAYAFYPGWLARASYNRLFIEPPISQGAVIGSAIQPERVHQYEGSVEKQLSPSQRVKAAYYRKSIKNQVDTGLLIPSTQLGVFTSVSLERATVHGLEFSYELFPENAVGPSAFASYAWSKAEPSGVDSFGEEVPAYNDHDQRHTVSGGLAYSFGNGTVLGTSAYFGSGVASSALEEGGGRQRRFTMDASITSPPRLLFGSGKLRLTVANLFDSRERLNFNSPYSGTRFEQGRAVMLSTVFDF